MKQNIYRSAAQVTFFSIIEKALSFFYRIILSRKIGAEGVGIYQICLSVFAVFLTASSSGIPVTVSRLIAKNYATGTPKAKHAVVSAGVICSLLFTVPIALILFLTRNYYGFLFPDGECVNIFIILLPGLILTSVYAVMRGSFWGNKQFLPYSIIELAEDAVMVICGCILIQFTAGAQSGARASIIAVLVSYVFSFVVSLCWYFITGGRFVRPKNQFKPLFTASLPVTAMRTSTSVLNSCVAMFLPALLSHACGYSNAEALSIYGAVLGMGVPILFMPNSLIGSIAVVVAPEMSENFYAKRTNLLKRDIERTVKSSILIATVLIPFTYATGKDLGIFLYANQLSGQIISYFSFMMLPMCLAMITTTVLNSMHYEVRTLIYYSIGAGAMLVCIFALTPLLGIYAYMVGLTLSFIISAILNLALLKKNCPNVKYASYTIRSIVICFFACLFGQLLSNLLVGVLGVFWKIAVCGISTTVFTVSAFYGLKMLTLKPFKKLFAKKNKESSSNSAKSF
ncbi:MAG: oligosaccharide flippase family protein [Candidatus Coproplasma sp.]